MKSRGKIVFGIILLFFILVVLVCAVTISSDIRDMPVGHAPAALINKNCATRYPVIIAHHWGPPRHREKDAKGKTVEYFYRPVVDVLRRNGADVHVVVYSYDYDTTPARARELKKFIYSKFIDNRAYRAQWSMKHPGEKFKVNLVGHSQGCQDSRYMIANEGMADMTASWTGFACESLGIPMADLGIAVYDHILPAALEDRLFRAMSPDSLGDAASVRRFIESVRCLTEDYMQNKGDYGPGGKYEGGGFRADYSPGVYYQNWAAKLKWMPSEWSGLYILWKYIRIKRGDNDIYTPVSSQIHDTKHVVNRGVLEGEAWGPGVHHMAFTGSLNQPNPGFAQEQFWIDLVADLRARGY
ncbi:MAG TPA: hypothetical protein PLC28_21045 [Spirochaetota bacterium]|nr:hypothetical protein [Spirochaetota bacterium]HPC43474.1 hypothetical protein [Spirochaetota bacterium]HPL17911.1 hypothetical protein [Spirochaetota bacterium]HQJ73200.1 hypothetical protein [Spirochaetota bacterium]HRS79320.1 hypothetical protein [Spirochaetota bacterium]